MLGLLWQVTETFPNWKIALKKFQGSSDQNNHLDRSQLQQHSATSDNGLLACFFVLKRASPTSCKQLLSSCQGSCILLDLRRLWCCS